MMKPPLSRLPALPITAGWIAGILLYVIGGDWQWCVVAVSIGMVLMLMRQHYMAFVLFATGCAWCVTRFCTPAVAPDCIFDGEERTYIASVLKVRDDGDKQSLILRIDSVENSQNVTAINAINIRAISLPDWSIRKGDRLKISTVIEPVDNFGDFPYDRNLHFVNLRAGVTGQVYLSESDIIKIGYERGPGRWFDNFREKIIRILARADLSEQAYGVLTAITVGYDDELDQNFQENFRVTGLAHILALSGFHVGVIVLIVTALLFPMRLSYKLRKPRLLLTLLAVWFYMAVTGMPDSAVRAVIMLSVYILSSFFERDSNPVNSLCVAIVIILSFSPYALFSVGFQLSVGAVAGILLFSEKINPFSQKKRKFYTIAKFITVPVSAVLGTIVVTLINFHSFSPIFIISNVVISILFPFLMFGGVLIIVCGATGISDGIICKFVNYLTELIKNFIDFLASLSYSSVDGIYLNGTQILIIVCLILLLCLLIYFPGRKIFFAVLTGFMIGLPTLLLIKNHIDQNEIFIVRQAGNTPIVIRDGKELHAIFTCQPGRMENATSRFISRLNDYLKSRDIEKIEIISQPFHSGDISYDNDVLAIGSRTFLIPLSRIVASDSARKVNYAIITSRYRGNLHDIIEKFRPDTLILSRDLSMKRRRQLLTEATCAVIDLRKDNFKF